ncbi:MAG TPA: ABC transporter permease [Acidimicrobiia bacterium]|nr:ABC transporter permease [Acidimicrobiia bacterium]
MRGRDRWAAVGALGAGTGSALSDFAAIFTWRSWMFGWLTRAASQACLYGLLGRLLGSPPRERYLFVGAAVSAAGAEALLVCASTVNERRVGALPLIVASPSPPFLVLMGRGMLWVPGGIALSAVCLFLIGPLFGIGWTGARVVAVLGLLVLTSLSTLCVGLALGSLVVARPELRNVVGAVAATGLVLACGITVPLSEWPMAVRAVGAAVPLTHTLAAVRAVLAGAGAGSVLASVAEAVLWGAVWLAGGWLSLTHAVAVGRRDGSIEFGG